MADIGLGHQFPPAARLLMPFVFGMLICYSLPVQISVTGWGIAAFVFVFVALFVARNPFLSGCLFFVSSFSLGAMLMANAMQERSVDTQGRRVDYHAIVVSQPEVRGKTLRFDALVADIRGCKMKPFKVKMAVAGNRGPIGIGNTLLCNSTFHRPVNRKNAGFDYARYLFTQGFKAEAFVYAPTVEKSAGSPATLSRVDLLRLRLLLFRSKLVDKMSRLGIGGDNLAVVSAMTLGYKSMLNKRLRNVYSASGASHVLALSGLHLGIIYSLLMLLLARYNRLWRWQLLVRFLIVCSVWGYVLLVGIPLSAVRSAIMLSVCSVLAVSNRGGVSFGGLSVAAALVLIVSPLSIFDVGFQMSFSAVTFILVFSKPIYAVLACKFVERNPVMRWCCGMIAVSLAAQVGTAPLAVYYFGRFPLLFLVTNFVAVPLALLLLYGGALLAVCSASPTIQHLVAGGLNRVAELLNYSLSLIASMPGACIDGIHLSMLQLVSVYILIAVSGMIFLRFSKSSVSA